MKADSSQHRITIDGAISAYWFEDVSSKQFLSLLNQFKSKAVELVINSDGGDVFEGQKIGNHIAAHDGDVTAVINVKAFSIATYIIANCSRVVAPANAKIMIHDVQYGAYSKSVEQVKEDVKLCENLRNDIAQTLAIKSNVKDKDYFLDLMTNGKENFFTAQEALEMGLIDEIIEASEMTNKYVEPATAGQEIPVNQTSNKKTSEETMDEQEAAINAAINAENQRQQQIRNLANKLSIGSEIMNQYCDDKSKTALDLLNAHTKETQEKAPKAADLPSPTNYRVGGSDAKEMIQNALDARAGVGEIEPNNYFEGRSMVACARELCGVNGYDSSIANAAVTSTDFADIVGETTKKVVRDEVKRRVPLVKKVCTQKKESNFKKTEAFSFNDTGLLGEVAEKGAVPKITIGGSGEEYKVKRYAKDLVLTYEAILDDDIDAISRLPRKMVQSAYATADHQLIQHLLTGKMKNNKTIFHASHNNLSQAANHRDAVVELVKLLESQVSTGGDNADLLIEPEVLLCGVSQKYQFKAALETLSTQDNYNAAYKLIPQIVSTNALNHINGGFILAHKDFESLRLAVLEGNEEPSLSTKTPELTGDNLIQRITWVFAVKSIDSRGLARVDLVEPEASE